MEINELPLGPCILTLRTRSGEKRRVKGKVVRKNGERHLIVIGNSSRKSSESFAPNTKVLRYREKR